MIDLLMSGDVLLDQPADVDRLVGLLVDRVGIPDQRPTWGHAGPGYRAMFVRVHKLFFVAPTTIEVLAGGGTNPDAFAAQRDRPVRTHATVFATKAFDELADHVRGAGLRHVVYPPDQALPFPRLWFGLGPDGTGYRPEVDGGLRLEVIPYEGLRIPEAVYDGPRPEGSFERMVARTFLVDDVDATIDRVRACLGWDGGAEVVDGRHGPTAVLVPADPLSAALELVRPTKPGRLLDFYEQHGAGPYAIRLGVNGLDATLADLDRRGTRYDLDGSIATIDPDQLEGLVVELTGMDATSS
ncbi:MAG: hypothetical protein AB7O29_14985 [Acidimicrobiia bacterium]